MYVTRVSSKLAAEQLARAKRRGVCVFGEALASSLGCVVPSSLPLIYRITSPPLRSDPEASRILLKYLAL